MLQPDGCRSVRRALAARIGCTCTCDLNAEKGTTPVVAHNVVSHDQWVTARKKHLAKEKEFTHLRDQLSRERRELPWELVDKDYTFEGESGKVSLQDLFAGRNQLVVYHAMFNPETAGP